MHVLEKNIQVNFKTNSDLLEKAKAVMTSKNLDMTASFNMFLDYVVKNNDLPFETNEDKERMELIEKLCSEIAEGIADFENGRVYTIDEVRENLGIS